MEAVLTAINAEPLHRVSWCVIQGVPAFWDHLRITLPHVSEYSQPCSNGPVVPEIPTALERAIAPAFKGTRVAWLELLSEHEQVDPGERNGFGDLHPGVLELIGKAVGIELPPVPQWNPRVQPASATEPVIEVSEAVAV